MGADKILLMNEGEQIAMGTHNQLANTSTLYQKIVESQFGKGGVRLEAESESSKT